GDRARRVTAETVGDQPFLPEKSIDLLPSGPLNASDRRVHLFLSSTVENPWEWHEWDLWDLYPICPITPKSPKRHKSPIIPISPFHATPRDDFHCFLASSTMR